MTIEVTRPGVSARLRARGARRQRCPCTARRLTHHADQSSTGVQEPGRARGFVAHVRKLTAIMPGSPLISLTRVGCPRLTRRQKRIDDTDTPIRLRLRSRHRWLFGSSAPGRIGRGRWWHSGSRRFEPDGWRPPWRERYGRFQRGQRWRQRGGGFGRRLDEPWGRKRGR